MSVSTVLPIWQAVQERFQKSVKALTEEELGLSLGLSTIGSLLRHNSEVEFLFAEWFFGKVMPAELKSGCGAGDSKPEMTFAELLDLLAAPNFAEIVLKGALCGVFRGDSAQRSAMWRREVAVVCERTLQARSGDVFRGDSAQRSYGIGWRSPSRW